MFDISGISSVEDGLNEIIGTDKKVHDVHWKLLGKFQRLAESYRRLRLELDEERARNVKYESIIKSEVLEHSSQGSNFVVDPSPMEEIDCSNMTLGRLSICSRSHRRKSSHRETPRSHDKVRRD